MVNYTQEDKQLIIARLEALKTRMPLSERTAPIEVILNTALTIDQEIVHVNNETEIGKLIIEKQLKLMNSFK